MSHRVEETMILKLKMVQYLDSVEKSVILRSSEISIHKRFYLQSNKKNSKYSS